MKSIKIIEDSEYDYDCKRICKIFASHDFFITLKQSRILWEKYSESMAAGWLYLPQDDDEIWFNLAPYWEED